MSQNTFKVAIAIAIFFQSCNTAKEPAPVLPVPSQAQVAYQEMEMNMFVHFNMNTFTNKEWGFGDASPELFNPTELDCKQWARVAKESGMKGIILTAKHHDGFCLWPSKYTEHSVKNAPWKNGQGDVVQELVDACQEYGLKVGLYLSPWDRNHARYGSEEYITYFRNQLEELLTNYGDVFEVWFDGANGGDGYYGGANEMRKVDRKTYYNWAYNDSLVLSYQPEAIIFSDNGPGTRWVGNEEGWANPTNWSLLRRADVYPGMPDYQQLRSGHEDGTHWVPAECDVSIRPGWYYHPYEDQRVRPLSEMVDIYYHSIGRNGTLLLNFPVDQRGLIHENDEQRIKELMEVVRRDLKVDLAEDKHIKASNIRGGSGRFSPSRVNDKNTETYWATDDHVTQASLTIDFGETTSFNRLLLQEYIRLGQRIKEFSVEILNEGQWQEIAKETTVGYKRILRLDRVSAEQVRINIVSAKASPTLSNVEVYNAPVLLFEPEITRDKSGLVSMESKTIGTEIYYTLDGSTPSTESQKYSNSFKVVGKKTVRAIAYHPLDDVVSQVARAAFDVCKEKWRVISVSSGDLAKADQMVDENPRTVWGTQKGDLLPQEVIIDLGEPLSLAGFTYLPKQSGHMDGTLVSYSFYVSQDGKNWGQATSQGEFSNIRNNTTLQRVEFSPVHGRFVKFVALAEMNEEPYARIAELGVITN